MGFKRRNDNSLSSHLRHRGCKYQERRNKYKNRGVIPNRKSIDGRPAIVDAKQRFGDFEMDCIIGQNRKEVLLTINDRASGLLLMRKLPNREAELIKNTAIELLMPYKQWLHTITTDNGKEFALHEQIAEALDVEYYFAHPYHTWERGANENLNGLVRQYFPKGSSFENKSNEFVQKVVCILNNRHRERHNFSTPIEVMNKLINNYKLVAL